MSEGFNDGSIADITKVLTDYFDGLFNGDVEKFGRVFHELSHLYFTDGETVTDWPREKYFEIIADRPSPASQGLDRFDKILSIHKSGPDTALATVNCAVPPRYFTDYLTLVKTGQGWRIISKTFHTDTHE
ncbi:MAG: nuclear transport factor 2 family protein [Alphaproteobacteria bacterium]|nr:nuclear transport factor 2 family protein [Alphaproteobacteria bacterium]